MTIVTNQAEFLAAVAALENEIIVTSNISLNSPTNIGHAVSITGQPRASLLWTNPTAPAMFVVTATGALVIASLTLDAEGRDGTLVRINGGSFTMNNDTVLQNIVSTTSQGAVIIGDPATTIGGTFIMNGGLITGIDAFEAVRSNVGTIIMNNNASISDNSAAGLTISISMQETLGSTLTMTGQSRISNNQAKQSGGAGIISGSTVIMGVNEGDAPVVTGNRTPDSGGGWYLMSGSSLTMRYGAEISDNYATQFAGGVAVLGADIIMRNNAAIRNNRSDGSGGGLLLSLGSTSDIGDQAQISGNTSGDVGAGVLVQNGSVFRMNGNASIHDNISQTSGGGIYITADSTLAITGTNSIVNNSAPNGNGGGIFTANTTTHSNLTTGNGTVFRGNTAINPYTPPPNAGTVYPNIQFASTSVTTHPLNNYDINFIDGAQLTYHVLYNANGGTGSFTGPDIAPGDTDTVVFPATAGIARPGHTFTGWNTQQDGSGTSYAPGDTITLTDIVTLYAQWTTNLYTVTYSANGGTDGFVDAGIPFSSNYTVLSRLTTRTRNSDRFFTGWNTQRDGSGIAYTTGSTFVIEGDITLYAQWVVDARLRCSPCRCPCC